DKLLAKVGELMVKGIASLGELPLARMPGLRSLTVSADEGRPRLASLDGIEAAPRLETLDVDGHAIADLSPLAKLASLQNVCARYNKIRDLSPLTACRQLQILTLSHNLIANASPLASLTKLERVWLDQNAVRDLTPLFALPKLASVKIPQKVDKAHVAA